jgi:hypothetical protein
MGVFEVHRTHSKSILDDEEWMKEQIEYARELDDYEWDLALTIDRLSNMIIFEKDDFAIWGETKEIFYKGQFIGPLWKCIRVPKKDIEILRQGKDEAISILTEKNPEIDKSINSIIAVVEQLDKDQDYLTNQLNDSLFCKIFLGDCKYLGGPIR